MKYYAMKLSNYASNTRKHFAFLEQKTLHLLIFKKPLFYGKSSEKWLFDLEQEQFLKYQFSAK